MDYMMPLTYVSFSYLSKVNLGRKVVHWTRTLSQDSCSLYEPMYPTNLSPLLLSCPYLFIGLGNWVGGAGWRFQSFHPSPTQVQVCATHQGVEAKRPREASRAL